MAGADVDQAEVGEIATFVGWADPISGSIPYHAWRPVFARHFAVDSVPDAELRGDRILERLADHPHWLRLAPLLAPIVEAEIEENAHTSRLLGSVRAGATQELLVGLLAELADERPVLVVLDDAHWLDSASLSLALEAAQKIRRLSRPPWTSRAGRGPRSWPVRRGSLQRLTSACCGSPWPRTRTTP